VKRNLTITALAVQVSAVLLGLYYEAGLIQDRRMRFHPSSQNPILRPLQPWEAGNIATLSVIKDGPILRGAYWAGPYSSHPGGMIAMATSPDGVAWTRSSDMPAIGDGHGGEIHDAERPTLIKIGDEYRIYYQGGPRNATIKLATSRDGVHFMSQGALACHGSPGGSRVVQGNNVGLFHEGRTWFMSVQVGNRDGLFSSADGKSNFEFVRFLDELQQPGDGNYSGRSFFEPREGRAGGEVQDFYCSRTPAGGTEIFHAAAAGAPSNRFVADSDPVLATAQVLGAAAIPPGPAPYLCDPCLVEFGQKVFMYFTIADNRAGRHRVGVAVFPGSEAQLMERLSRPKRGSWWRSIFSGRTGR
jgi:hypothetical protein